MANQAVTESLVDAKDEAVEARMVSRIAQAVADLRKDIHSQTLWIVGWVTVVGGAIIAVLR
ncbi:MAG: hypothetical protein F4X18_10820 [Acidimicrobiia bacterium]|nr:hypothetical protein [Acidimicrobiia bacterium]MYB44521.1 hypothetical protein [Acidimicrobiia bacterium]MYC85989.1 hypothetical protein [Acidimicrobiia bacterium]